MQPTFLPWAGYFRLMAEVDQFVILDDVQISRQSWQTRNRVLVGERVHWIVVPIRHTNLEQTIASTELAQDGRWRLKTGRLLRQTYARHPYAADLEPFLEFFENGMLTLLADLNTDLIKYYAKELGITTSLRISSGMALDAGQRTERLIEICRRLGCDSYLSPVGSADYLEADGFTRMSEIGLEFAHYSPPPYTQRGVREFVPNLSIVDVVANLGWQGAADYVRARWHVLEQAK